MAIRTGMQTLVDTVRGYASAGISEWSIVGDAGTISYWSDVEIQRVLDRHKTEYIHADLDIVESYTGGAIVYKQYRTNVLNIESGTDVFKVEDTAGTVSGYTADYARGIITFSDDQAGKSLWWSGYAYDINASAADIWRMKAAHAAELVDWSTDGHSIKHSQTAEACLKMANFYQNRSPDESVFVTKLTRDDV